MNKIQISIRTTEEQLNNSRIMKHFIYAFNSYDMNAIEEMLHERGVFFGKFSQKRALGIFHKIFFGEKGIHELCMIEILYGIALDGIPGADVVEFRCSNKDPFSIGPQKKFGDPADKENGEKIIRLCFEFKNDKIFRIMIPKRFTSDVEHFKWQN